jgi:hypothetical protein
LYRRRILHGRGSSFAPTTAATCQCDCQRSHYPHAGSHRVLPPKVSHALHSWYARNSDARARPIGHASASIESTPAYGREMTATAVLISWHRQPRYRGPAFASRQTGGFASPSFDGFAQTPHNSSAGELTTTTATPQCRNTPTLARNQYRENAKRTGRSARARSENAT